MIPPVPSELWAQEQRASTASRLKVPLLDVQGLRVALGIGPAQREILPGVSFCLERGAFTCLVGASGCGKSLLLRALLGIIPAQPGIVGGRILFFPPEVSPSDDPPIELLEGIADAVDHSGTHREVDPSWREQWLMRLRPWCGSALGYVAQHAWQALDPTRTAGFALMESIRVRRGLLRPDVATRAEALDWLEQLGFPEPTGVFSLRPHELSGGMAQRLVIAIVLARGARTLLADEPTSGLDQANAASLIALLLRLRERGKLETLLLVTHDLGVAERLADRLMVMHQGLIVEEGLAKPLLTGDQAHHPRSIELITGYRQLQRRVHPSVPDGGRPEAGGADAGRPGQLAPRLRVEGLHKGYARRISGGWRRPWGTVESRLVLQDVSLDILPGETVGLMGPSGVGKSTLARCILGELLPDRGEILLEGQSLRSRHGAEQRGRWRLIQPLYQQVDSVLHPRMRVEEGLWETARVLLRLPHATAVRQVEEVLEAVGLTHRRHALPGQLSGGELRRVGLARVLLVRPRLVVADEPTAGVDASLRAGVLELLSSLCRGSDPASLLIISHDRQALEHVADRILVLRDGRLFPD